MIPSMQKTKVEILGALRPSETDFEYLIIGAGICGMYQLHRLLELGVKVTVLEADGGVGGTWYRNRYPGCRFDSESYSYGYSFSGELLSEWDWSERFAPQPETLRYLNHVADKFDLRPHIQFNSRVTQAHFDEERSLWRVRTEDGREITSRFVITALGLLSTPTTPRLVGIDKFKGTAIHTYYWPEQGIEVRDKRVAVIGTGSTGVQVISTIASEVASLTVFQRNPNWCAPLHNAPLSKADMDEVRESYDAIFEQCRQSPTGFLHRPLRESTVDVTREERLAKWEELYAAPGFGIWLGNYRDTMTDEAANQELSEFIAEKIRSRVKDPDTAEKLIPKDHGFGTKRVPLETRYYEAYNHDHVELIDAKANPILEVTENGILYQTEDGPRELELDVIVFATGFDAITGAFDKIDFQGVEGVKLKEKWAQDPSTYLGVQTAGFPNLLICVGPQSGSVSSNFPRGIEDAVDWVTQLAEVLDANDIVRIEPVPEAEQRWGEHVREVNSGFLLSKTKSWFNGHNVNLDRADSPRQLIFAGGGVLYRRFLAEEAEAGYPNFRLFGSASEVQSNTESRSAVGS